MYCARDARKLADYISKISYTCSADIIANNFSYSHVGALFTDVVLQAGLNYKSVVQPRVQKVLSEYPNANTITKFQGVIDNVGLSKILSWNHPVKLERFERLMNFAGSNRVDSFSELQLLFAKDESYEAFLSLNGFGPKSLDYMLMLLNIDNVAVDRHIYAFVKMADIETNGYYQTKKIVEYAADFLNMRRSHIDKIIWTYMSEKHYINSIK